VKHLCELLVARGAIRMWLRDVEMRERRKINGQPAILEAMIMLRGEEGGFGGEQETCGKASVGRFQNEVL
jgi:hypothetical protein